MEWKKYNIWIILCLFPILWGFYVVNKYGVNILCYDEFEVVKLMADIKEGTFHMSQLFALHNEHRFFFPRVIMLIIGYLTAFNTKRFMLFSLFLVTATYVIYLKYISNTFIIHKKIKILMGTMIGFLCFNIVQYQNFLWGFQIAWFLIVLCAAISFYNFNAFIAEGTYSNRKFRLCICLGAGIIASFSSLHGLFVWAVLIFALVILKLEKVSIWKPAQISIAITSIICFLLYFHDFDTNGNDKYYFNGKIIELFEAFFEFLGNPISTTKSIAITGGIIIFILSCYHVFINLRHKNKLTQNVFPLMLMAYGYIATLAVAFARIRLTQTLGGIESRYATNTITVYIGLLILIFKSIPDDSYKRLKQAMAALMLFISCFVCAQNIARLSVLEDMRLHHLDAQVILYNYEDMPLYEFGKVYPFPTYKSLNELCGKIKNYKWNIFSKDQYSGYKVEAVPNHVLNNREYLGEPTVIGFKADTVKMEDGFLIIQNAWAFDPISHSGLEQVLVKIGESYYKADYGKHRPDVSTHFSDLTSEYTGFDFTINLDKLVHGKLPISIVLLTKDRKYYQTQDYYIELYDINHYLSLPEYSADSQGRISAQVLENLKGLGRPNENNFNIQSFTIVHDALSIKGIGIPEAFDGQSDTHKVFIHIGDMLYPCNYEINQSTITTAPISITEEFKNNPISIVVTSKNGMGFYESSSYFIESPETVLTYMEYYNRYIREDIPESRPDTWLQKKHYMGEPTHIGFGPESLTISGNQLIIPKGWAFTKIGDVRISDVFFHYGPTLYRCNKGLERYDVADYFSDYSQVYSGFSVTVPYQSQEVSCSVVLYSDDANGYFETPSFQLKN